MDKESSFRRMPESSGKTILVMKTSLLFRLVALFMLVEIACADELRPNILFILTDNQAASLLGTYGNPDIRTPHIDQLAREGMKFTRAYAVNGMCSPTRATLMTGLMPSQHGIHSWLNDELLNQWPCTMIPPPWPMSLPRIPWWMMA